MRLALVAAALWLTACGSAAAGCPSSLPADQAASATGCLRLAVIPDSRRYSTGVDKITFTVSATNLSAQPCAGSSELVCGGPALNVADASGKVVWNRHRPAVPCPLLIRLLQPGETMTAKVDWPSPGLSRDEYSVTGAQEDFGRAYFSVC
jgi:hypothetical protein